MKRTPEQIKAWRENIKALATKVKAMPEAERERLAAEYGTITAEGHRLSAKNTLILAFQAGRPLAQVGGFRQWKKAGRMVRKGEHSIGSIFVPLGLKSEEAEIENPTDNGERLHFRCVPVFDVTQTEEL